jgi:hypothetical protein
MMRVFQTILACVCIALSTYALQISEGWRGLTPLHSTRTDVERLLGAPEEAGNISWYRAGGDLIGVEYATSPCKGNVLGWNVPADTVLEITVRPQKRDRFDKLEIDKSKYVQAYGHVTGVYINLEEGIRYGLYPDGTIVTVSYIPTKKDNRLRCPGFPPYDGEVTQYRPLDEYGDTTWEHEKARLDNLAIALQTTPDTKGYIIVYAGQRACVNEAKKRAQRAREYLINRRRIDVQRVIAVDGGYRSESVTELHFIPSSMPAPTPKPTIATSEVQLIKGSNARNNYRCPSQPHRKPR